LPSNKIAARLHDILMNIARIERFVAGMDRAAFENDEKAIFASLHALLIISEAARKLGTEADMLMPEQPWAGIRGIGNVLRHDYDGVDPAIVWRVLATGDLESLRQSVERALGGLTEGDPP